MQKITDFFRNIWRAIRQAAIDPVVDAFTAVSKGEKMTKKQKEVVRDILILVGAVVLRFIPYTGWLAQILTVFAILNALMVMVEIIDALAKGDPDQSADNAAPAEAQPA